MAENTFLTYKGKPLVRSGDTVYYGDMADKYVIMMKVLTTKKVGGMKVADKVSVELVYSDQDVKAKDRTVKKSEKNGLYNAMDIGAVWLERALAE